MVTNNESVFTNVKHVDVFLIVFRQRTEKAKLTTILADLAEVRFCSLQINSLIV